MSKRIVKLRISEGSTCPVGANQRAHIRLFKMAAPAPEKPQPRTLWSKVASAFTKPKESTMTISKLEEIKKRIADRKAAKLAKTDKPATDNPNTGRSESRERLQKRLAEIRKNRDERNADKGEAQAIAKAAQTEVVELKKALDAERSIRLRKEFVAKAEHIHVAGKTSKDDVADALMALSKSDPKLADKVEQMLTETGNAWQAAAKELTKIIGSDNDTMASTEHQQLMAIAKTMQEKDDKLTPEQAYVKAMDKNPDLANRLR